MQLGIVFLPHPPVGCVPPDVFSIFWPSGTFNSKEENEVFIPSTFTFHSTQLEDGKQNTKITSHICIQIMLILPFSHCSGSGDT